MQQYLDLLRYVLSHGVDKKDRTGTGTRSIFGYQMQFSLKQAFPLLTTKKLHFKSIVCELLWFLRGSTTLDYLHQHGVTIWDHWADKDGNLGPVYGHQWRSWLTADAKKVDQIKLLIHAIKHDPDSRRLLVSAWNVGELSKMALPPCHVLFQFYVSQAQLSCQLYQRSGDIFLGIPFNIASYALLTLMVAQVCDLQPDKFIHTIGDAHLYLNHLEQAKIQLTRKPLSLPRVSLAPHVKDIFNFKFEDFVLENYKPYPSIKAPIAV